MNIVDGKNNNYAILPPLHIAVICGATSENAIAS